jgi:hypothetical protein
MSDSSLLDRAKQAYELRAKLLDGDQSVRAELDALEERLDGRVYMVPAEYMPQIQNRMDRCARAAISAGLMPPMMRELERSVQTVITSSSGMRSSVEAVLVLMQAGAVDAGEGWKLVATVVHDVYREDGVLHNRVHVWGGVAREELDAYKTAPANCDHCGLKRNRIYTYLMLSPDGKLRQVGASCIKDYIGQSAENAARQAERMLDLGKILRESEGRLHGWLIGSSTYDPSSTGFFDPEQYLGWVAREIRLNGWVSRSEAWAGSGKAASADNARSALLGALGGEPLRLEEEDEQLAEDTLRWIQDYLMSKSDRSSFEETLVRIADKGLVAYRELPRLAPAITSFQRYTERMAAVGHSRHIGALGERVVVDVKINQSRVRDTHFGLQHIYEMEDGDGNQLVWFSSGMARMEEGESYQIRGTVKRHETYRDAARTVLTNCRVVD